MRRKTTARRKITTLLDAVLGAGTSRGQSNCNVRISDEAIWEVRNRHSVPTDGRGRDGRSGTKVSDSKN